MMSEDKAFNVVIIALILGFAIIVFSIVFCAVRDSHRCYDYIIDGVTYCGASGFQWVDEYERCTFDCQGVTYVLLCSSFQKVWHEK